ncbi:MAG: 30S ribosomal protein S12 methylthiotransferase RimO [Bacteroidales bacterium]|nr:30S ribosomal protein S12 methylthiotransferase RimO [Bacteroidales bacterium]
MIINIITLGCSKNVVDSEHLLYQFRINGLEVIHGETEKPADIVIINTCGFILDAREESIDTVLYYTERKKKGYVKKLLVMGCLSQRYEAELRKELPEVDGFYGVWDWQRIIEDAGLTFFTDSLSNRVVTTPGHYAFLKISEGCDRTCSFCSIPLIRGSQQSLSIDNLLKEARNLAGSGVRELILIAQDLTNYGIDIYGKRKLPDLLKKLLEIMEFEWIRLHYAYPAGFPEAVLEMMASEKRICNYLDVPIQHVNSRILKNMGRGYNRNSLEKLLFSIRSGIPDVAIRTTLLVGYPGETESEFEELIDFISDFRFDRLGVFPYSHEEGTRSFLRKDDVPEKVKKQRCDLLMDLQQEISLNLNCEKIGKTFRVLIDHADSGFYAGRTQYDSPEIDQEVLITRERELKTGDFYAVKITEADMFDLHGEIV